MAASVTCAAIAVSAVEQTPRSNAYTEQEGEQILRAYDERSSLRGLSRT
jgi:hypothetical protein